MKSCVHKNGIQIMPPIPWTVISGIVHTRELLDLLGTIAGRSGITNPIFVSGNKYSPYGEDARYFSVSVQLKPDEIEYLESFVKEFKCQ